MRTDRQRVTKHASRPTITRALQTIESLEDRRLLAAHIVGSSAVYSTIQAAVDAAAAGATVTVDAGTYAEQVTIAKPLTIQGAEAGVDATSRAGGAATAESIVTGASSSGVNSCAFYVSASDVTIDGFTVQGETNQSDTTGAGIVLAPGIAGARILNNVVQNNVAGLFLANNSTTDAALIQHNYFANNNNSGGNSGRGIYTDGGISGGNLTNVTIDSNSFVGNYGPNGLEAACAFQATTAGAQSNIRITKNVMSANGKATLFFNTTGVVITNNTITGCIDAGSGALRFEGNNHNVTIQYNTAHNNAAPAVAVDAKGVGGDSSGFTINYNNFYSNNTSTSLPLSVVFNDGVYTGTFDARYNWWGNASGPAGDGPGTGDAVSAATLSISGNTENWVLVSGGGELYSSWLTAPYSSTPTLPTAPNGLTAGLAAAAQINLSWTDTAPGNESGFIIQRSSDGVNFAQIGATGSGITKYVDTANITVGTTYTYRVAATNSVGTSPYSAVASVTVTSTVTTYISDLSWVSATIGYGTIGIDKSEGGNTLTLRGVTYTKGIGTHAVSQIVYNLNSQYTSFASDVGVDDEENLKGVGSVDFKVIGDGITLFDSGVLTNSSPIVHLNVSVAGVKQLTLLATNGVAGTIDYDHADWAGAKLTAVAAVPSVPASPSGLTAVASSPGAVSLAWTDNAPGNEAGFIIQRSTDGVNFTQIGLAATGVTHYTDTTATVVGTTYTYRVAATNAVGTSGYSPAAAVTIPALTVTRLTLAGLPASTIAGTTMSFKLTALDAYGNPATSYVGTVHFTSTDAAAGLPANYTFTAADAGVHTFWVALKTAGSRTLTATDTAIPALTATSSAIMVNAATAAAARLSIPSSIKVNTAFNFTVTIVDAYGNRVTGYLDTVHFSASTSGNNLPGDYTFQSADAGVHTFKATFKARGTQTLTMTDKQKGLVLLKYTLLAG